MRSHMFTAHAPTMNRPGPDPKGPDPDDLPDGCGTNADSDHTTEGGDDDQFKG